MASSLPSNIHLGAQNCHHEEKGAFTGEVSTAMLADMGCRYVILGHSERRLYCGEANKLISQKAERALTQGLIPIICVGESLNQRETGIAQKTILEQLEQSIPISAFQSPRGFLVAYEPIWAIGTGLTASQTDIEEMHTLIKAFVSQKQPSNPIPILYGGSVNGANAKAVLSYQNVDGVLVGGSSLKVDEFEQIINS